MSIETQPASYSLITEDNAPVLLRNIFDLVESRYVRRTRYIEDGYLIVTQVDSDDGV